MACTAQRLSEIRFLSSSCINHGLPELAHSEAVLAYEMTELDSALRWLPNCCWTDRRDRRSTAPLTTTVMNTKQFFAFLFEWLLHGVILRGNEAALAQGLARVPADYQNHFLWVVLGEAIMVFMFTMIYARCFAAGGVGAGVGLGIMFALFTRVPI